MSTAVLNRSQVHGDIVLEYERRLEASGIRLFTWFTGSTVQSERYGLAGAAPRMQERLGQRNESTLNTYLINIENRTFDQTLRTPREDFEDDQTGQVRLRHQQLGLAAADLQVELIDTLIGNGATTTNGTAFDNKKFFSASGDPHTYGSSGNWINDLTASEVSALNVATPTAPTVEETADVLMHTIAHFANAKDDTGRPVNVNCKSFTVVVPPALQAPFATAAMANNLAGGETSALKMLYNIKVVANPTLGWTDKFAIFIDDQPNKPFILQERVPLTVKIFDEETAPVWVEDNNAVGTHVRWRGNAGYGDFRKAIRATLS